MPVSPFSRYAGLPTVQVVDSQGRTTNAISLRRFLLPDGLSGVLHQVVGSEAVDAMARQYYGREENWWQVMDGNPLRFPLDLKAGDTLLVPPPRAVTGRLSREERSR